MNDHDYAIAVGISFYPSDFATLMTAPKDATRFMEWIGSEMVAVCQRATAG